MRSLVRLVAVVAVVLGLPILTAPWWSGPLQSQIEQWQQHPPSQAWLATGLILVLASDILLPVPSGPVITLAGGQLGAASTAVAAWFGLTLGGVMAFAVAKRLGPAVTGRFVAPQDLPGLKASGREHDAWLLLVTRPLPVLAEATVIVCGTLDTSWHRLLWTLGIGNAVVATAFAVLGERANEQEWMLVALVLSVVVPLSLTWIARRRWLQRQESSKASSGDES